MKRKEAQPKIKVIELRLNESSDVKLIESTNKKYQFEINKDELCFLLSCFPIYNMVLELDCRSSRNFRVSIAFSVL